MSRIFETMTVDERLIVWPTSTTRFLAGIRPLNEGDPGVWLCDDLWRAIDQGQWSWARFLARSMPSDQWRPDPQLDRGKLLELPQAGWCLEHRDGLRCGDCTADHLASHDPVLNLTCPECGHIGEDVLGAATAIAMRPAATPYVLLAVAILDDGLCGECRNRR